MARDFSPEERLLRLIRSKAAKQISVDSQKDTVSKDIPIKREISSTSRPTKILKLENLNLVLILLLAGLLIYFVPLLFKKQKSVLEELGGKIKSQEKEIPQKEEEPKKAPFNYFAEQVGSRNIFSPVVKEETQAQTPIIEEGPKLEEVKSQLNLLGVVWGANPQAIIEDKKAQKTHFLNKGEQFEGIEVKDILENKVILIYKGQEFELVL